MATITGTIRITHSLTPPRLKIPYHMAFRFWHLQSPIVLRNIRSVCCFSGWNLLKDHSGVDNRNQRRAHAVIKRQRQCPVRNLLVLVFSDTHSICCCCHIHQLKQLMVMMTSQFWWLLDLFRQSSCDESVRVPQCTVHPLELLLWSCSVRKFLQASRFHAWLIIITGDNCCVSCTLQTTTTTTAAAGGRSESDRWHGGEGAARQFKTVSKYC